MDANGSALDVLKEFTSAFCSQANSSQKLGSGCDDVYAIRLSTAPPPEREEFAHECAIGFIFADEMKIVRQLQQKYQEGKRLVKEIYCARSCARAIPPLASDAEPATSKKYYLAIFTVLQPQMDLLKELIEYCAQTVLQLSDNIQRITVHENTTRVIPDILMDALLKMMDVLLQLSHLHDKRTSLRNDFSVLKRAFTHVMDQIPNPERVENDIARVQEFIGKGSIWDSLRHNLTNVKRFDQVTFLLVKHCIAHIENDIFTNPNHRFRYIRVIPSLLAVVEEGIATNKVHISSAEKKVMESATKLLYQYPVVPIYAEMSLAIVYPFPAAGASKTDSGANPPFKRIDTSSDLMTVSATIKNTCEEYLPRLIHAINQSKIMNSLYENGVLYEIVVEGIQHLCSWKCSFQLFISMKYQSPKSNDWLRQMDGVMTSPYLEYERVTKYNYSRQEWRAVIDVIYVVKSIVQVMRQNQSLLRLCISRHIYHRIQVFTQHTLLPILHRADKRKLVCTKMLHDLRLMCGDWIDTDRLVDDYKKKRKERKLTELNDRLCKPSRTSLLILRTVINATYEKRSMGNLNAKQSSSAGLFSFKKDLESSDVELLAQFYREAGAYIALLKLEDTLTKLADFSLVWFRESYLEIGKVVQFPTGTSLLWLLMEQCLGKCSKLSVAPALAILDMYNDAGRYSVHTLKKQHLYDETEAEAKLCFDQFVCLLSESAYSYYKNTATMSASKRVRLDGQRPGDQPKTKNDKLDKQRRPMLTDEESIYKLILRQEHIELLGQSYDLKAIIHQHVHQLLHLDLENWLYTFESNDATNFTAAKDLLDVLCKTHQNVAALLALDEFDDIKRDIMKDISISVPSSIPERTRVQQRVNCCILESLCQGFSYNFTSQRFVKTATPAQLCVSTFDSSSDMHNHELSTAPHASDFKTKSKLFGTETPYYWTHKGLRRAHCDFFGLLHVEALTRLLPFRQTLDVANECIEFIMSKIRDILDLCISALGAAIPPFHLPRFMYRCEGCYGYFNGKFKHLFDSQELEQHVFHCFREVGNALIFLLLLSDVISSQSMLRKHNKDGTESNESSNDDQEMNKTHQQRTVFRCALERIHSMLHTCGFADEWHADPMSTPNKMPNSSSFYHVWCALEFLSCDARDGSVSIRDQFGDGVQFAGCMIIHLLQQRSLYELWNVNQHVLNVHQQDQATISHMSHTLLETKARGVRWSNASATPQAQSVGVLDREMNEKASRFVELARQMRTVSHQIFHLLEMAWPSTELISLDQHASIDPFSPPTFVPPLDENAHTK